MVFSYSPAHRLFFIFLPKYTHLGIFYCHDQAPKTSTRKTSALAGVVKEGLSLLS